MTEHVRIPKLRVAVVIGKNGDTKKMIEDTAQVALSVNSEGEVEINKNEDALDPLAEWTARDMVRAIGRGFPPEKAMNLIEDSMMLEVIDLTEFAGKSKNCLARIESRLIGTEGKCREHIEEMTETDISIYGKTVSIIGRMEGVSIAKEAIIKLANGQMHSTVYRFLEKMRGKIQ